jgi:4'-phosphopantetheinyl transferase
MTSREPFAGVRVWEFGIDLPGDETAELARHLCDEERARAARFTFPRERGRFAAGRGRLRVILGGLLGAEPRSIAFVYGPRGKPALAPPWDASGLAFSLSHSAGQALLAVSAGCAIGCDLEAERDVRYGQAVARRFFSEDENRALAAYVGPSWTAAFFRCWTRKEAFIKALGDGLAYPTRRFTVALGEHERARLVRVDGDPEAARRWRIEALDAPHGFAAAVCVAVPDAR